MLNTGEKDQVRSCKKWEEVPDRGKKKKKSLKKRLLQTITTFSLLEKQKSLCPVHNDLGFF